MNKDNRDYTNINLYGANHTVSHGALNNKDKNQLDFQKIRAKDEKFHREQEKKLATQNYNQQTLTQDDIRRQLNQHNRNNVIRNP